jgi:uncharacterized protein YeaO (DUF488 family)
LALFINQTHRYLQPFVKTSLELLAFLRYATRMTIQTKRAYDAHAAADGARYLVDRLWPRGIKREALHLDGWLKEIAPSDALRKWFGHDPARWEEFCRRYERELDAKIEAWQPLLETARRGLVTLVYSAKDREHNQAVALKAYLEKKLTTR